MNKSKKLNIDVTYTIQPKILMKIQTCLLIFKIPRKKSANQKSEDFFQMFKISKMKARTLGKKSIGLPMDLEINGKSYSLGYGFSSYNITFKKYSSKRNKF